MASISKRNGSWRVDVCHRKVRRSRSFATEQEARQWAADIEAELKSAAATMPKLSELAANRRPKKVCAVYFLFDELGKLLYVGQTSDLYSRLRDHIQQKQFDSWSHIVVENPHQRIDIEAHYINTYSPPQNKLDPNQSAEVVPCPVCQMPVRIKPSRKSVPFCSEDCRTMAQRGFPLRYTRRAAITET